MPKKVQATAIPANTLDEPIAQPIWDAACAHHRAQKEYDRVVKELERAATALRSSDENLSAVLKNHGIGSVVIEMNSVDRLVAVFDYPSGSHSFLVLNVLSNTGKNNG